jgi:glycosyltransferase involved in cell wall biosynthesis
LDQKGLRQLLSEADAYVAPSIGMEAFSIAALEGATAGLPLLLSDRVGLADFLDGADFISYAHNDEEALRRGIQMMMNRREDASWSDRKARHERMQARFSPKMIAQKIIALIQSV